MKEIDKVLAMGYTAVCGGTLDLPFTPTQALMKAMLTH